MFLCFYVFIHLCFYVSIIYYSKRIGLLRTRSGYVILENMKKAKLILNVSALSIAVTLLIMVTLSWLGVSSKELGLPLTAALVCPISTAIAVGYFLGPELWSSFQSKKSP